ncbi:MAG: hypothetical protein RLZZ214_327, partial [Verrucomicrobiota bacterium]
MKIRTQDQTAIAPSATFVEANTGDGSTSPHTYKWGEFSQQSANNNQFIASTYDPKLGAVTVENLTPLICSVENWPLVEYVSSGAGRIKVSNGEFSRIYTLIFSNSANFSYTPTGFVSGSYADFAWDIIKPLLDASSDLGIFTNSPSVFPNGIYNPGCWAADFDFSGVAYWNETSGTANRAGTLITDQHIWAAWHYPHAIGKKIRFVSKSSPEIVIERTIVGMCRDWVNGARSHTTDRYAFNDAIRDIKIFTLNSPVPASIATYDIAGDWSFDEYEYAGRPALYVAGPI